MTYQTFLRRSGLLLMLGLCALLLGGDPALKLPSASAQGASIVVVNAASFFGDALAPDSIAAAFGAFNTVENRSHVASALPLPTTLGGVRVTVNNIACGLFYASPTQVNFALPPLSAVGTVNIVVTNADNSTRTGTLNMQRTGPGIFTASGFGTGAPAALTTADGVNFQLTFNADGSPRTVSAGTRERPNFLILNGTGIRNGVAEAVTVTFQGVPGRVTYAGRVGNLAGLDQLNVAIPPELSGFGLTKVRVEANGRWSNTVTINIGGQPPPLRASDIAPNNTVSGALSNDDQVQDSGDGSGRTYFFDAYRLRTTAADTTVAIDVRSAQFDAVVQLVRQGTDGALTVLAADDQTGGLGNGQEDNNNALLLTVLRDPGDYFVLVSSADAEPNATGGYSARVSTGVVQPLSYSATPVSANIANTDVQTSAGDFLDAYWFAGNAGDFVQIRMASTAFDSFLFLSADTGELIEFDDNSGGGPQGRDALLTSGLPQSGNYIIIATPYEPGRTGAYMLTLNRLNSSFAGDEALQLRAPGRSWQPRSAAKGALFKRLAARRVLAVQQ
jgi:uncharacterized protein (TIGR03437 family)